MWIEGPSVLGRLLPPPPHQADLVTQPEDDEEGGRRAHGAADVDQDRSDLDHDRQGNGRQGRSALARVMGVQFVSFVE